MIRARPPQEPTIAAHPSNNSRAIGALWLFLSPIAFVMAAISTVESEIFYRLQLVVFSVVAAVGFVSGLALTLGRAWGRRVIEVLSWLGLLYYSGTALILAFYIPRIFWNGADADGLMMTGAVMAIGATGAPFFYMARALRRDSVSQEVDHA